MTKLLDHLYAVGGIERVLRYQRSEIELYEYEVNAAKTNPELIPAARELEAGVRQTRAWLEGHGAFS